jgi:hypothetical protein
MHSSPILSQLLFEPVSLGATPMSFLVSGPEEQALKNTATQKNCLIPKPPISANVAYMNHFSSLSLFTAMGLSLGCASKNVDTGDRQPPTGVFPDFSLVDENPNSASFDQEISPRDHLEKVSGWYFIHAT